MLPSFARSLLYYLPSTGCTSAFVCALSPCSTTFPHGRSLSYRILAQAHMVALHQRYVAQLPAVTTSVLKLPCLRLSKVFAQQTSPNIGFIATAGSVQSKSAPVQRISVHAWSSSHCMPPPRRASRTPKKRSGTQGGPTRLDKELAEYVGLISRTTKLCQMKNASLAQMKDTRFA